MAKQGNACTYTLNVGDDSRLEALKLILAYESRVRGLFKGQVLFDMVMEAADFDSYPAELRDELDRVAEERKRQVVERSLRVAS